MFQIVCICIWLVFIVTCVHGADFDVLKFGAKADGKTDDSKTFMSAWAGACQAAGEVNTVSIPSGKYLVGPVKFVGPCKAPITVQAVEAVLLAPQDPKQFSSEDNGWFVFSNVDHLTLNGGMFDGQGAYAWEVGSCGVDGKICNDFPVNLAFYSVTNSTVHGIKSKDSKFFQMKVDGCKELTFSNIAIEAPEKSPNTDGIHIARSLGVYINTADIQTGDDCVSIGDGAVKINVQDVNCGPGHGLSIGSLGKNSDEKPVVGITFENCNLTNTQNGVRIKTWASSTVSAASNIKFLNITMNNVGNPIVIDQHYCPDSQCGAGDSSQVKIEDARFNNIKGTTTTIDAVQLICSKAIPCEGVELENIELVYKGGDGSATSSCANVNPKVIGKVVPPPCSSGPPSLFR